MTTMSCASTASTQKSTKTEDQRSKSCATTCSSNSSCFLQRRKPVNPLAFSFKPAKTSTNTVKQRVLSAKLLKLRSIQNKLNDANFHLAELSRENQVLKSVQKRQEKSLSKYENTNADLPRLLRSHEEEIRALTERNKSLRRNMKDLNDQLKLKDEELLKTHEKLNHLEKLNKDKHLTEREKLFDQLEDLKLKLQKSEEEVNVLNRKLMLESKASKQRLNSEISKYKQCHRDLLQALTEIDRLTALLETKENVVYPRKNRFDKFQRDSVSMITLKAATTCNLEKLPMSRDIKSLPKTPVMDVKLEPIVTCKKEHKKQNDILTLPSENVKSRLSVGSTQSKESEDSLSLNSDKEKSSSEVSLESREPSANSVHKSRPASSVKLEKLMHAPEKPKEVALKLDSAVDEHINRFISDVFNKSEEEETDLKRVGSSEKLEAFDEAIKKATEDSHIEFDKKLGSYCAEIVNNVKNSSKVIETHKENLKLCRMDTDNIIETLQKTEKIEKKLKNSFFNIDEQDMDFIKEILTEECNFQQSETDSVCKEPKVKKEDKKKLLATLRAIDNGDSIDNISSPSPERRHSNLMAKILGDAR